MSWLIIIVVVMAVLGSVYWLKPSARDSRLAALRLKAIQSGIHVRHQNFQVNAAKTGVRDDIIGTAYTLVRPANKQKDALLYRVAGQSAWDNEGLPEGLSWHDKPANAAQVAANLSQLLAGFNDEILLLEVFENRATLIPAEHKSAQAEQYLELLQALLPRA